MELKSKRNERFNSSYQYLSSSFKSKLKKKKKKPDSKAPTTLRKAEDSVQGLYMNNVLHRGRAETKPGQLLCHPTMEYVQNNMHF